MIGYLDCSTGVSGDKLLGALIDAGTQAGAFTADDLLLIAMKLAPEARVNVESVSSHGIAATGVTVTCESDPPARHLADVERLLAGAGLPEPVHEGTVAAFRALAEVEAEVHGTTAAEVHFHEVGATDAIVDIAGVFSGMHALGITDLTATPIAVGSGSVETAHGVLPVPAPATARLLVGMPVWGGLAGGELTTPTGAVLTGMLTDRFGPCPPMRPLHIGYGAGTREIGMPNVCRLMLGEPDDRAFNMTSEQVVLLESNVDHVSGEEAAFALQQLLDEGCLDVWIAPIVMKKGRAAMLLSALVDSADAEHMTQRLVALTGTLGVRRTDLERSVAEREVRVLATAYGPVRVKAGGGRVRPEFEDIARIARETGQPYRAVLREVMETAQE